MARSKQMTGNVGLYYVAYELSKGEWNVLPTSRNTKGIDMVIFDQDGKHKHTIQIKTLTKRAPIPLGSSLEDIVADFLIVCVLEPTPEAYIMTRTEVLERDDLNAQVRAGKKSIWAANMKDSWADLQKTSLSRWDKIRIQ